jgi:hypothetical protein
LCSAAQRDTFDGLWLRIRRAKRRGSRVGKFAARAFV